MKIFRDTFPPHLPSPSLWSSLIWMLLLLLFVSNVCRIWFLFFECTFVRLKGRHLTFPIFFLPHNLELLLYSRFSSFSSFVSRLSFVHFLYTFFGFSFRFGKNPRLVCFFWVSTRDNKFFCFYFFHFFFLPSSNVSRLTRSDRVSNYCWT